MVFIKTTGWKPDTCGCNIQYEWDRDIPLRDRVMTFKQSLNICPDHLGISGEDLWDAINTENKSKNVVVNEMKEINGVMEGYIEPSTGEPRTRMKWGTKIEWSFTGQNSDRILDVELTGKTLTVPEKANLQAFINAKFPNKVRVK